MSKQILMIIVLITSACSSNQKSSQTQREPAQDASHPYNCLTEMYSVPFDAEATLFRDICRDANQSVVSDDFRLYAKGLKLQYKVDSSRTAFSWLNKYQGTNCVAVSSTEVECETADHEKLDKIYISQRSR